MGGLYVGIEIGGTKLQMVAGEGSGRIVERRRFTVDRAQGGPGIRKQIESALPELIRLCDPAAVAVGFGGPVDWRTGHVARSHQIEGWSGFALGAWLETLSGKRVLTDNDANLGALGEAVCGAGVGCNPVFYVTLGSGVGGGLVVDGRVYHGARPGESELGHVRLDRQGTIVEARCSGWAVDAKIRRLKESGSTGLLAQRAGNARGGEAVHLTEALNAGDPEARRVLDETAQDLAFALSHVTHLFHPEVVVLGGGLSLLGEPLRAAVAQALPGWVMEVFAGGPQLRLAALGEDAVPVGCLVAAGQGAAPSPIR
jgi:glucokinase